MSGLISSIVAVAGFGPPPVSPTQRRRKAAPVRARKSQVAAPAQGVRPGRPLNRMDENFGGPYVPSPTATSRKAPRVPNAGPISSPRVRKVNGTGMLILAMGCMGFGGWVGSHVQAFAEGSRHAAAVTVVDPGAIVHTGSGPTFSF